MLTPDEILAIKQDATLPRETIPGIYFLIDGNAIVYIGQARNFLRRIRQHRYLGEKQFTYVSFVPCATEELDTVEADYITVYRPKYNNVYPIFPRWFTLERMSQISHIPLKYYLEYVEQEGIVAIKDSYRTADFAKLHSSPPELQAPWADGMSDETYRSLLKGEGREIHQQMHPWIVERQQRLESERLAESRRRLDIFTEAISRMAKVMREAKEANAPPQGTAECPQCNGYGRIGMIVDWQTNAEPCPRCEENGYIPISDLTPRERSSWYQREYRKRKKQQAALDEQEQRNDEADALWEAGGYYGR